MVSSSSDTSFLRNSKHQLAWEEENGATKWMPYPCWRLVSDANRVWMHLQASVAHCWGREAKSITHSLTHSINQESKSTAAIADRMRDFNWWEVSTIELPLVDLRSAICVWFELCSRFLGLPFLWFAFRYTCSDVCDVGEIYLHV